VAAAHWAEQVDSSLTAQPSLVAAISDCCLPPGLAALLQINGHLLRLLLLACQLPPPSPPGASCPSGRGSPSPPAAVAAAAALPCLHLLLPPGRYESHDQPLITPTCCFVLRCCG